MQNSFGRVVIARGASYTDRMVGKVMKIIKKMVSSNSQKTNAYLLSLKSVDFPQFHNNDGQGERREQGDTETNTEHPA